MSITVSVFFLLLFFIKEKLVYNPRKSTEVISSHEKWRKWELSCLASLYSLSLQTIGCRGGKESSLVSYKARFVQLFHLLIGKKVKNFLPPMTCLGGRKEKCPFPRRHMQPVLGTLNL